MRSNRKISKEIIIKEWEIWNMTEEKVRCLETLKL